MDTDEISKLVRELKLSKEALSLAVSITPEEEKRGEQWAEKRVVGKIFSKRMVNKETVRNNLPRIIRARGRVEIDWVGHNLFVVTFSLAADKRVALEDGPWHFFQDLLLLKETGMMQTPADVVFDEITMWVQCHNVPMACMEAGVIRRIGEKIGKVLEVDEGEEGRCAGKIARVRVSRKIEEPLVRCVPITQSTTGTEVLVILQYEKLPQFCFSCGVIGHIAKECDLKSLTNEGPTFSNWLRAGRATGGWMHRPTGVGGRMEGESSRESGSIPYVHKELDAPEKDLTLLEKRAGYAGRGGLSVVAAEADNSEMELMDLEERGAVESTKKDGEKGGVDTAIIGFEEEEEGIRDRGSMEDLALVETGGEKPTSPPVKNRNKRVGKAWKRRAREGSGTREKESRVLEGVGLEGTSRKRGGLEMDSGIPSPKVKSARIRYEHDGTTELTAEAAEQPRRGL